jgi:hypothetical protein
MSRRGAAAMNAESAGTKPAGAQTATSPITISPIATSPITSPPTVSAPAAGASTVSHTVGAQAAGAQVASAQTASTPTASVQTASVHAASVPMASAPTPSAASAAVSGVDILLKIARAVGAGVGYGCLAVFLALVSVQVYRWFRDGEWTHFGISEALRAGLVRCCVNGGDTGRLAALVHWIDAPVDWLGLHQVLEIAPASLGLFALSILGNSIFIYCSDRIDERRRPSSARATDGTSN